MRIASLICVCAILVAMSPAAVDAFSQISGARILYGTMDLQEHYVIVCAIGVMEGMMWQISCIWVNGMPGDIYFTNPRAVL